MTADDRRASGLLVLAGTPIGALTDATPRLLQELRDADVIAAEDTRRVRKLATLLEVEITAAVVSYFEGNEATRTPELLARLQAGERVVLVTDAGMPSVSDPGYRLVAAAVTAGITVTAAPGPSAVLTALAVAGLPVDRFCFEGFLSRKAGERSSRLGELATEQRTMVFFESPHRLGATLTAMADAFGVDRAAAICRELTKLHEEVVRGPLGDLAAWAAGQVRGEITLVVAGAPVAVRGPMSAADLAADVALRESAGVSRKDAIGELARELGVPKRTVYDAVVVSRRDTT